MPLVLFSSSPYEHTSSDFSLLCLSVTIPFLTGPGVASSLFITDLHAQPNEGDCNTWRFFFTRNQSSYHWRFGSISLNLCLEVTSSLCSTFRYVIQTSIVLSHQLMKNTLVMTQPSNIDWLSESAHVPDDEQIPHSSLPQLQTFDNR